MCDVEDGVTKARSFLWLQERYIVTPRFLQASDKQMGKLLLGICFGCLATGAKMGMIYML